MAWLVAYNERKRHRRSYTSEYRRSGSHQLNHTQSTTSRSWLVSSDPSGFSSAARTGFVFAVILICSPLCIGQPINRITKPPVVFWVDWDCLRQEYPKPRLDRVVHHAIQQFGGLGVATWGNRASAYDLDGNSKPEYFIPLRCGATGNCSWGIFGARPSRLLGVIIAENIYVRKRTARWATLTGYVHGNVSEGIITDYHFRNGKYRRRGRNLDVSAYYGPGYNRRGIHPFPRFMRTVSSPCSSRKGY